MPVARQRTFNKADARKPTTASGRGASAKSTQNKHASVAISRTGVQVPGTDAAFAALMSARICAALWSHISDCDETFNYWEPMHYLIFGSGLQTWEYSPEYALRSYTYLLLYGVPAFIYRTVFGANPVLVFYFVRFLLGLTCSAVEVYFYKSVCREFGLQIGRLWLLFQLFSPGMFVASAALLPSSFAMYACSTALAAWWNRQSRLAILCIAIAALLGWPFAALVGVPIAGELLLRRRMWRTFLLWSAISAVTVLVPQMVIDSSFFGRWTLAPLNIVLYNVFGTHGPNLYGTEPWHYYALNGLLNFNILWPLALGAPVLLAIGWLVVPTRSPATLTLPYWISLAPFYLWLGVFVVQPHKEERFLYPVYFMVALCAAIAVDVLQRLAHRLCSLLAGPATAGAHYLDRTMWMAAVVMLCTTAMGLSRIAALYVNYHAPLDVWQALQPQVDRTTPGATYNVCAGKDWYRLPGSFFLPGPEYRLRFVRSEFDGMLPAYFADGDNGTAVLNAHFNDANRGDAAMLTTLDDCEFLFDLDVGRYTELEPNYAAKTTEWQLVRSLPFVDAVGSHPVFRAFYVPILSTNYVRFGMLNLLQRINSTVVVRNEGEWD